MIGFVTDAMFGVLIHRAEVSADQLSMYDGNRCCEVVGTLPKRCKVHVLQASM